MGVSVEMARFKPIKSNALIVYVVERDSDRLTQKSTEKEKSLRFPILRIAGSNRSDFQSVGDGDRLFGEKKFCPP
jgi:hypothetical protein